MKNMTRQEFVAHLRRYKNIHQSFSLNFIFININAIPKKAVKLMKMLLFLAGRAVGFQEELQCTEE